MPFDRVGSLTIVVRVIRAHLVRVRVRFRVRVRVRVRVVRVVMVGVRVRVRASRRHHDVYHADRYTLDLGCLDHLMTW